MKFIINSVDLKFGHIYVYLYIYNVNKCVYFIFLYIQIKLPYMKHITIHEEFITTLIKSQHYCDDSMLNLEERQYTSCVPMSLGCTLKDAFVNRIRHFRYDSAVPFGRLL